MSGSTHIDTLRIAPEFAARVIFDAPMSKYTSWHAGGPAAV